VKFINLISLAGRPAIKKELAARSLRLTAGLKIVAPGNFYIYILSSGTPICADGLWVENAHKAVRLHFFTFVCWPAILRHDRMSSDLYTATFYLPKWHSLERTDPKNFIKSVGEKVGVAALEKSLSYLLRPKLLTPK